MIRRSEGKMKVLQVLLVFGAFSVSINFAKKLPDFVQTCSRAGPDDERQACVKKSIAALMPYLVKGIPEMGVPSIDPLLIPQLNFDTGEGTHFSFVANITDVVLGGAKDMKPIVGHIIDNDVFEIEFKIPELTITGQYKALGKVLVIQFNGGGQMSLNATDVTLRGKLYGSRVTKKGKEHYKFIKDEMSVDIAGKIATFFENLLPDKEINDRTNQMINENAEMFYEELKPMISSAISKIIANIFNEVHQRFSNEQLYPEA